MSLSLILVSLFSFPSGLTLNSIAFHIKEIPYCNSKMVFLFLFPQNVYCGLLLEWSSSKEGRLCMFLWRMEKKKKKRKIITELHISNTPLIEDLLETSCQHVYRSQLSSSLLERTNISQAYVLSSDSYMFSQNF